MILLVAHYSVREGEQERVATWLQEMAGRVQRDEPGCLTYVVGRSRDTATEYTLVERYADEAAVARHRQTPHYRELIEGKIVPCLTARVVEILDPVASVAR
jgi:(4S)-4-hydroxy-5-phosphonooxypentane-2,3-dione isomerase